MVKRLQLARSPGKREPETSCNYTELGVVMLPPSVSGVKCRFVTWCLLKRPEGEHPSGCAPGHQRKGLQGQISNQMNLSTYIPHDLHLPFLTDICAIKYILIIKLHSAGPEHDCFCCGAE